MIDYAKELGAMQKHFGITTEDFNVVMKLFIKDDHNIVEIHRGITRHYTQGLPLDASGTCDYNHYQYITRVLFPIVGQAELEDMGFSVAGYFESRFTDMHGEQVHTDPDKFHTDRYDNFKDGKRKWMFRTFCKAVADRKVIKGTEQTGQTIYILDPERFNEMVFLKPTDEQIENQKKAFLESSYYQTLRQNGEPAN